MEPPRSPLRYYILLKRTWYSWCSLGIRIADGRASQAWSASKGERELGPRLFFLRRLPRIKGERLRGTSKFRIYIYYAGKKTRKETKDENGVGGYPSGVTPTGNVLLVVQRTYKPKSVLCMCIHPETCACVHRGDRGRRRNKRDEKNGNYVGVVGPHSGDRGFYTTFDRGNDNRTRMATVHVRSVSAFNSSIVYEKKRQR